MHTISYFSKLHIFQILKNNGHPNVDFKLIAENVDPETELSTGKDI